MPNWLTNTLVIKGESGVLACLDAIRGEPNKDGPRHIDFEKIVPMPAILSETECIEDCERCLLGDDAAGERLLREHWVRKQGIWDDLEMLHSYIREHRPEVVANAKAAAAAKVETGYWDWSEWRFAKWQTDRNAAFFEPMGEVTDTRAEIIFCTARRFPELVIQSLSRQFPKLRFRLKWWDTEDGFRGILQCERGGVLRKGTCLWGPRWGLPPKPFVVDDLGASADP